MKAVFDRSIAMANKFPLMAAAGYGMLSFKSENQMRSDIRRKAYMATKLVEYLATTRLGERGTMTLPKEYRDALKLESGAPVTVLRLGDGLILMPEQNRFELLCDSLAARLENAGITETALQSTLPETRRQIMERRYPKLFAEKITKGRGKKQ